MSNPGDKELFNLETALVEGMRSASDEETIEALRERGIDPDACVAELDAIAEKAFSAARRQRLETAKAKAAAFKVVGGGQLDASAHQAGKARLNAMRSGGGPMLLAARKGTGTSERDEESLIDDAAELERLRRENGEP